ncbi:SDR family NAD(P)-dependent oxidoreductase [Paenibacillus allorhizosphaerae]|uniref:4-formylbenzenesulfonate dehydrogenase TsaC1/TsaC2 n=1 Tax=Paenibacillus allorhizosphaerae TaxID=2849866 RepID=A0ABN7TDH7_9BACL|nr:SDR family NAD(P)-dependent oxidoreductase [Paenibacillus allorhizosphaerae]CAG7619037.1 4-formylbenzenesulfonate dehydrogenase TsaC1/TsaC2 [Paenibacillus allorhizosphaerae]
MNGLQGKIALVTGGSRGAGRGIAIELARAGAVVYVTGRSVKGNSTHNYPGTIDDTAAEIRAYGGTAYACRCDHTKDEETAAVVERIRREQGQLHIVVNNVWGGHDLPMEVKPFWELPLQHWDTMFHGGVRAQLVTNHYAIPLLRERQSGLIVHTTFRDQDKYTGTFYYDLAKNALCRMAFGLATELRKDGISVVALSPGWMRTELVLANYKTDEEHWKEVRALERSESPYYIGRAVCALAGDSQVMRKSGQVLQVGQLADEYGFTDIDGRTVPPFII